MAEDKKVKVNVLRNICVEEGVIIRKGSEAELTQEEYESYFELGAVKRVKKLSVPKTKTENKKPEGGDA